MSEKELREKIAAWFAENYPPEITPCDDRDYEYLRESYLNDADSILSLLREEGVDLEGKAKAQLDRINAAIEECPWIANDLDAALDTVDRKAPEPPHE